MANYYEAVSADTPRLELRFRIDEQGREQFEWGMQGGMPILSLISAIINVQHQLQTMPSWAWTVKHDCPEQKVVLAWNTQTRSFDWFAHKDTPRDAVIGMLEMIKATIVAGNVARQMASQQLILGIDGRPVRR